MKVKDFIAKLNDLGFTDDAELSLGSLMEIRENIMNVK